MKNIDYEEGQRQQNKPFFKKESTGKRAEGVDVNGN